VFTHVQRLPLSFPERDSSGQTISRLTSDVESLAELLDEGLDGLLSALFSVLTIGVVLLVLDLPLGLVALLGFPVLFWVARWFQRNSTAAYRRTRETIAALIVHFTETFGGIRAVLGRPSVLVLDDPLSALDVHTESLVEEALRRVLAGTTALVVAHRPSTVLLADRVALLVAGRIAAVGTHSRLLAEVPAYRDLLAQDSELAELRS
jgi:ABC-type multidrug transport system fused ATPase/permease subunit